MRVPTPNPPPGIIGHNRSMLTPNYCVFPPEGIMDSLLPNWPGCIIRFQTSRQMGAAFAQALLIVPAGAGSAGAVDDGVQAFLYVQAGAAGGDGGGAGPCPGPRRLRLCPPGRPLRRPQRGRGGGAGDLGAASPTSPRPGRRHPRSSPGTATRRCGTTAGRAGASAFSGLREMGMDFEMNIMCYAPGAHFWCIETHVMEHGMVMLQGQALQLLGRDWHEIWTDDFVWMGPYVPQQIYATGNEVCEYLLYKDVNRDVI